MIILIILIILVLLSFNLFRNLFKSDITILDDVKLKESEPNNNGFALMLQKSDGSGYEQSNSSSWPTDMKFNSELSGCIDVNGNKIDNALSFDSTNNLVNVSVGETAYCYLYFDKDNSVYAKVVSDYTNGNGVSKLSDSDKGSRDYDTYYYTGNITNNNVLYADYCWKMVITTEGNGVKMIYNGVPTDGSCDNTEDATTIGNSKFNEKSNSLAYIGYMYNKVYTSTSKSMLSDTTTYIYGNKFVYNNGTYILNNTMTSSSWSSIYSDGLNSYHYSCFNVSGTCTSLYYIYYTDSSYAYYITLTDGKSIEDALNEMLYAEDVNTTDSTIKVKIDSWYESNLLSTQDSEGNLYSSYLQNTIYCNNREMSNKSTNGWNAYDGSTMIDIQFNIDVIDCKNKNDQFTLSVDKGGTEGYGNNALTYPIGLLTYRETILAKGNDIVHFLNSGTSYFLLSASGYVGPYANFYFFMNREGITAKYSPLTIGGIRPAIALSSNVEITIGDGSVNNPYQVKLS